jgi:hypothetical protein
LFRYCSTGDSKEKQAPAREAFHIDKKGGKYSSKTLKVEGLDATEMGVAINESPELYKRLIKVPTLSVQNYPNVIKRCETS